MSEYKINPYLLWPSKVLAYRTSVTFHIENARVTSPRWRSKLAKYSQAKQSHCMYFPHYLPLRVLNFDLKLLSASTENTSHLPPTLSSETLCFCNDFPFTRIVFSRYGARWILRNKLWGLLLSVLCTLSKQLSVLNTMKRMVKLLRS